MVTGLLDVKNGVLGSASNSMIEALKEYQRALFPFLDVSKKSSDLEMKKVMEREMQKGPIAFNVIESAGPLSNAVKKMQLPDEARRRLLEVRGSLKRRENS